MTNRHGLNIDIMYTIKLSNNTGTFPKMWECKQPTIDKFVLKKLNELEQEIKELNDKINQLKKD